MIPKKIHYVWVGGKELPEMAKKCLASWKEKLPDFEIIRWDETNSPMDNAYVKAMYDQKLWAFVSDYIRFWVLEKEGGIYLDTDTLVLKNFDDKLLHTTFFGYTPDGYIGCGVIGAAAHDSFIQDILAHYNNPTKSQTREETSPIIVTKIFKDKKPAGVKIYDSSYFNPCSDGEKRTPEKLKNAYADNLWAESWVPFRRLRKFARRIGVMNAIKFVLGK
ncbi:MAG: glycosyltransferase [Patescibacteria group bacterium]